MQPARIGKYEIHEVLGGGMSKVYRATDPVLGRRVAVKVMADEAAKDDGARGRFLQEARLTSSLQHDNIISVYEFGEDVGVPYMVMELLEGESLRAIIEGQRAGSMAERVALARQVAKALSYCHSRKVIHRDVKPENVHVDRMGRARLMDFGIASTGTVEGGATTAGTPFYMAPEQVLGVAVTHQADVFSFGVMLYELFTGQKPFLGKTIEETFDQVLQQPVTTAPLAEAGVPEPVIRVIARCTEKKLLERASSIDLVLEDLQIAAAENPAPRPARPPATPGLLSPSSQRPEATIRLAMPPRPSAAQATPPAKSATPVAALDPKKTSWGVIAAVVIALTLVIVGLATR